MEMMRLIIDPPTAAARNMAMDEALLDSVCAAASAADAVPSLRFYRWTPPAISLGYFQPVAAYDEFAGARACSDTLPFVPTSSGLRVAAKQDDHAVVDYDLVRRPTGGGAILHDDEVTYCLAMPADWPGIAGQPTRLYAIAHRAIAAALAEIGVPADFHSGPCEGNAQRGPFFCFARRHSYDLVVGGAKIVGSAQRRRRPMAGRLGAVLQHGSIILRRTGPQPCVGVNDCLTKPAAFEELLRLLTDRFANELGVVFAESVLSEAELENAARIETKYASDEWTRQR